MIQRTLGLDESLPNDADSNRVDRLNSLFTTTHLHSDKWLEKQLLKEHKNIYIKPFMLISYRVSNKRRPVDKISL